MSQSYVVVGAYGGIGSTLCRRLAKKGAKLVLAGRDEVRLSELAAELGAEAFCFDACNLQQVESCMKRATELHGPTSGVANCVGSLLLKPAHLLSEEEWDATVATNLKSAFAVVRGAALTMAQQGGSVVLLSTAAARIGLANHEAISAAKAGIEGLALAASASYAPKGIRVNCVAPGMTRTPLTAKLLQNEMMAKASAGMHALGRIGEPDAIASEIEWLLDPEQSWVTGQVIGVDGGLSPNSISVLNGDAMFLKLYCIALPIFFGLDMVWLGVAAKSFYTKQIGFLMTPKVNWAAAILFYLLFLAGLVVFVIAPAVEKDSWVRALLFGGFFGLITYATYDLTNLATLKDWPLALTVVDLIWGTVLAGSVSVGTYLIANKILR